MKEVQTMKTINDVMELTCFLMSNISHWEVKDGCVFITAEGETKHFSEIQLISLYCQSDTPIDFLGKFAQMWCNKQECTGG
jgi:hypothetical protein